MEATGREAPGLPPATARKRRPLAQVVSTVSAGNDVGAVPVGSALSSSSQEALGGLDASPLVNGNGQILPSANARKRQRSSDEAPQPIATASSEPPPVAPCLESRVTDAFDVTSMMECPLRPGYNSKLEERALDALRHSDDGWLCICGRDYATRTDISNIIL